MKVMSMYTNPIPPFSDMKLSALSSRSEADLPKKSKRLSLSHCFGSAKVPKIDPPRGVLKDLPWVPFFLKKKSV